MEINNKFGKPDEPDSSDEENNNFWKTLKMDNQMEVNVGDKIYVIKGDLKGTIGKIINFEQNKVNAIIQPTNLDGFEDDL